MREFSNAIVDDPDRTIPWIRTLLGDKAIETIELPITVSREYRDRLRAMFPGGAASFGIEANSGSWLRA